MAASPQPGSCHYTDCRQLSVGTFWLGMAVPETGFEPQGQPHVWRKTGSSGGWSQQHTWPDCAGLTHTIVERRPGMVVVRPMTLDEHAWVRLVSKI